MAQEAGTTRSAAAMELWRDRLAGALVVIGNAPTSLFRLLEMIADGAPRPAAVIGVPVGFVGAAESKVALAESDLGLEHLVVHGRRGGSRDRLRCGQRARERGRVMSASRERPCSASASAPATPSC